MSYYDLQRIEATHVDPVVKGHAFFFFEHRCRLCLVMCHRKTYNFCLTVVPAAGNQVNRIIRSISCRRAIYQRLKSLDMLKINAILTSEHYNR